MQSSRGEGIYADSEKTSCSLSTEHLIRSVEEWASKVNISQHPKGRREESKEERYARERA